MLPRNDPDRIQITFDDHRLVADAGLILPITLARHLGLPQLVQQRLDLGNAPGRANPGDKMMTLVASALAGGDRASMHLIPLSAAAPFGGFGLKIAANTAACARPFAAR